MLEMKTDAYCPKCKKATKHSLLSSERIIVRICLVCKKAEVFQPAKEKQK